MNWKVFWLAFTTIFLAEMADKTQFAVLSLVSKTKLPLMVFLGTLLAFVAATAIAVLFGDLVNKFIPENVFRFIAGGIFVVLGIIILIGKL
ncbi:MAG: TMEM165/GDT1 family protein [Candidatus Subteraquimicrobiales bacterium]|nr:TMEM165/GDT1 family protein [Candidatus Subteraquimicrobiales bacterium]